MDNQSPSFAYHRAVYWALPPIMALICWLIGRFLPDDSVAWVMLQAILLSSPPFWFLMWPIWALALAYRWKKNYIWLFWTTPWWIGIPDSCRDQPGGDLVLIAANVNAYTGEVDRLEAALAKETADVVIAVEKRPVSIDGMRLVAHNFDEDVGRPSHHSAVFCRKSCQAAISPEYGSATMKMPIATVRITNNICLIGVHSPPPAPIDATGLKPYIDVLLQVIDQGALFLDFGVCKKGDGVVVVGDLNAVPGSWAYRQLIAKGLEDRRSGSGLFGLTWPNGGDWVALPMMRLDHVLVGNVNVVRVRRLPIPDSDHMGLKVWLQSD